MTPMLIAASMVIHNVIPAAIHLPRSSLASLAIFMPRQRITM